MNKYKQSFIDYIQQDINNTYKERDDKDTGSVEVWQSYVSCVNDDEKFYSYLTDEFDMWLDNGEFELHHSLDPCDEEMRRFIYDAVMNCGGKEDIYAEFKNEMSNFIDVCDEPSDDEPSVVGTINIEMPSKDEIIRINMLTIDNLKREFNKERETLELEISEYLGIKLVLEAKLKKADQWTALQSHLDSYMSDMMCSCFQNAKDGDENAKMTIQNYISMYNCPNEFAVWLDEMMVECFTEHDPFEGVGENGMSMIRRDILNAQCGDGRRLLWQSFKDEMADVCVRNPECVCGECETSLKDTATA